MNPALQGYTAAVVETVGPAGIEGLAAELGAVDRLVAGTPELRSALTDTAVSPRSRQAVVEDLLAQRVGAPARRLVAAAALNVPAPDFPAAITWLANAARLAAAGDGLPEPSLGFTAARERIGGYARACFEDLDTPQLEEVEDELFRFTRTVAATPPLQQALSSPDLPADVRQAVVRDLVTGKVQPVSERLIDYVLAAGRRRDTVGSLDWLVERTAEARGWRVAHVRSGAPIDEQQQARLAATLAQVAGAPVELQVTVDETLLGGAVVQIGDLQVDASARGRLDRLREHLEPAGWEAARFGPGTESEEEGAG